jgi:hypothetical protein
VENAGRSPAVSQWQHSSALQQQHAVPTVKAEPPPPQQQAAAPASASASATTVPSIGRQLAAPTQQTSPRSDGGDRKSLSGKKGDEMLVCTALL